MIPIAVLIAAAIHTAVVECLYVWSVGTSGNRALVTLSLSFLLWALLFAWIVAHVRRPALIISLLILAEFICLFFTINYGVYIDANSLAFLMETNFSEAEEFIGPRMLIWGAAILLVTTAAYYLAKHQLVPRIDRVHAFTRVAAPAFFVGMALLMNVKKTTMTEDTLHYPLIVELPMAGVAYGRQKAIMAYQLYRRSDFAEIPFSGEDDNLDVVLIIGESARGLSFGVNGYERNTTPRLSGLDVISYRNMTSCGAATRISVPCLLTAATLKKPMEAASKISLVAGFKARGFTSSWFSSHRVVGENDSLISALANETDRQYFSQGSYKTKTDEAILAQLTSYLGTASDKGRLTIIHSIGSHWRYANRYGPEFARFTPVCRGAEARECPHEELVNAYDNSILATDHFIASIIASLANRNAFLIYTADHGESLGEDGNFIHGKPHRPEQRNVPLIFWGSDSYKRKHPERYAAALLHKQKPLTHDHIFHSMLNCAGIESSVIDRTLSLCSPPKE